MKQSSSFILAAKSGLSLSNNIPFKAIKGCFCGNDDFRMTSYASGNVKGSEKIDMGVAC